MLYRTLLVFCLAFAFTAVGCDDDDDQDVDGLRYSGFNGFVIEGDGFEEFSVDTEFNSGSASDIDYFGNPSGEVRVSLVGEFDGNRVGATINIQAAEGPVKTGVIPWGSADGTECYVSVAVGNRIFRSVAGAADNSGATTLISAGDRITGRFAGILTESTGAATIEVGGRFAVEN